MPKYKPTKQELENLWFREEDEWFYKLFIRKDCEWELNISYFDDGFSLFPYYWPWVELFPRNYEHLRQIILAFSDSFYDSP